MNSTEKPWIEYGYLTFAKQGPLALKVAKLAREIGINKSSFYHLFGDLDGFTDSLLAYHMEKAYEMAEKERACTTLPAFIDIIIAHKTDLLFNRQLRIHRDQSDFQACFNKINQISQEAILPIWAKIIDLQDHTYLAELVLRLSMENFFLQITEENLNELWLNAYFKGLKSTIQAMKNAA